MGIFAKCATERICNEAVERGVQVEPFFSTMATEDIVLFDGNPRIGVFTAALAMLR